MIIHLNIVKIVQINVRNVMETPPIVHNVKEIEESEQVLKAFHFVHAKMVLINLIIHRIL